ncbi:MAG: hypothetical protein LUQ07_05970 [Methanospirillum sp.]|nr:hypothetical protein [Methanospirillum sp.]
MLDLFLKNCLATRLIALFILFSLYFTVFGACAADGNTTSAGVFSFSTPVPEDNATFTLNTSTEWSSGDGISVEKRYNRMSDEIADTIPSGGDGEAILCYMCVPQRVNQTS